MPGNHFLSHPLFPPEHVEHIKLFLEGQMGFALRLTGFSTTTALPALLPAISPSIKLAQSGWEEEEDDDGTSTVMKSTEGKSQSAQIYLQKIQITI